MVGIWALVTAVGFMNGFIVGYMADIINHDISNIQIHNPEFKKDKEVNYIITNAEAKIDKLNSWPGVKAATSRVLVNGMIASPKKASGVQIRGIKPKEEAKVTQLDSLIGDGAYFEGIKSIFLLLNHK